MTEKGVIFDDHYVDGFLACALKDGYLTFRCQSESDKSWLDSYISRIKLSPFKRKSLEMALIFENVCLHDPPHIAVLEHLQREGLVTSYKISHESPREISTDVDESVFREASFVKPLLLKHLRTRINKTKLFKEYNKAAIDAKHKRWFKRWFTSKYMSSLYDIASLTYAGMIDDAKKVPYPTGMSKEMKEVVERSDYPLNTWFVLAYMEISEFTSLMDMSRELQIPFCSSRVYLREQQKKKVDALQSAYELCLVILREEVKYAPVVESIEDLLRLRDKPEIVRFREVLATWTEALLNEDIRLAERIKTDIQKANNEIRKLHKWRQVDRWLYYLALPTAVVPYLSNVVTMASVMSRWYVERTERIHGWIGIGR